MLNPLTQETITKVFYLESGDKTSIGVETQDGEVYSHSHSFTRSELPRMHKLYRAIRFHLDWSGPLNPQHWSLVDTLAL